MALTLLSLAHMSCIILLIVLSCLLEKLVDASLLKGDLRSISTTACRGPVGIYYDSDIHQDTSGTA